MTKTRIFISQKWPDWQDEVKLYPSFTNNSLLFRRNSLNSFYTGSTLVLSSFLPCGAAACCQSPLSSWPVPVWFARTQHSPASAGLKNKGLNFWPISAATPSSSSWWVFQGFVGWFICSGVIWAGLCSSHSRCGLCVSLWHWATSGSWILICWTWRTL